MANVGATFFSLPIELRNHIYSYILSPSSEPARPWHRLRPHHMEDEEHEMHAWRIGLPTPSFAHITQVSSATRREALPIYYRLHRFYHKQRLPGMPYEELGSAQWYAFTGRDAATTEDAVAAPRIELACLREFKLVMLVTARSGIEQQRLAYTGRQCSALHVDLAVTRNCLVLELYTADKYGRPVSVPLDVVAMADEAVGAALRGVDGQRWDGHVILAACEALMDVQEDLYCVDEPSMDVAMGGEGMEQHTLKYQRTQIALM